MKIGKRTAIALCPDCDQEIELGPSPKEGQKVTCPNCEADLEITSVDPLELSWDMDDLDEEWDDDDWDDDDWDDED